MNTRRRQISQSRRAAILRENNYQCAYCGDQATEVDHLIPYSYSGNNTDDNLVPSCRVCNSIASDKVFDGFIEKQSYILAERQKPRWKKRLAVYVPIPDSALPDLQPEARPEPKPKVVIPKPSPAVQYSVHCEIPEFQTRPYSPEYLMLAMLADKMVGQGWTFGQIMRYFFKGEDKELIRRLINGHSIGEDELSGLFSRTVKRFKEPHLYIG